MHAIVFNSLNDKAAIILKPVNLFALEINCSVNQLTGFYMMATLAFNGLRRALFFYTFQANFPLLCTMRISEKLCLSVLKNEIFVKEN